MKGGATLRILEYVGEAAVDIFDLTSAFLSAGHGASAGKILHEFDKKGAERSRRHANYLEERQQKRRFNKMLYKLKRDGLIEEKAGGSKSYIKLTTKGKQLYNATHN